MSPRRKTTPDLAALPWRHGRHRPEMIYARLGDASSDDDPYVGHMDTGDLAALVVAAHNERIGAARR